MTISESPVAGARTTAPVTDPTVISSIERFIYHEAALLDEWRLDEWLALMHPDVVYRVPAAGSEHGDAASTLQVIHDDLQLLTGRVTRLKSKHAHAESPKSRTRRLVTNVRAEHTGDPQILVVHSNFHVLRNRLGRLDHFVGGYRHTLMAAPDGYRILERVAILDHDLVEAGGTVSIVL
jgi:3-phenylpropionate/cinnamic acid dioxygenase small subunit